MQRKIIGVLGIIAIGLVVTFFLWGTDLVTPTNTPSLILGHELPQLAESTILINKYFVFVEFDNAKTYSVWLYVKQQPTREQIIDFVTKLSVKLTANSPGYYFNFEIFPQDSKKLPNDAQPYDTYASVLWRNNQVIFPVFE